MIQELNQENVVEATDANDLVADSRKEIETFTEQEQKRILDGKRPHAYKAGCACAYCEAVRIRSSERSKKQTEKKNEEKIKEAKDNETPIRKVEEGNVSEEVSDKTDISNPGQADTRTTSQRMQDDLSRFKEDDGGAKENVSSEHNSGSGNSEHKSSSSTEKERVHSNSRPQMQLSEFITGAMFLMLMDEIFPFFVKNVVGYFSPKYSGLNLDGERHLQLTEEQFKRLEPFADKLAQVIFINFPPEYLFLMAYGFISIRKVASLNDSHFDKPKKKNGKHKPKN